MELTSIIWWKNASTTDFNAVDAHMTGNERTQRTASEGFDGAVPSVAAGPLPRSGGGRSRIPRADGRATRERILRAARELFSTAGYQASSLRQIAAAAGIDLATLKYHFGDKQALYAQVYEEGHGEFLAALGEPLMSLGQATTSATARDIIHGIGERSATFLESHLWFARMVSFRFLEPQGDRILVEDTLQVGLFELVDRSFDSLRSRGLLRAVDTRAFFTMMISSFALWVVVAHSRPEWLGELGPNDAHWRKRVSAFVADTMERMLLM